MTVATAGSRVDLAWGEGGLLAATGDLVIVVDVLRFSTAVDAALSRRVSVVPSRWREGDPLGSRLSPAAMLALDSDQSVVMPSPNGATCALAAAESGVAVATACLRNAPAVAAWAATAPYARVTVLACGERWPDGSLRPALEDLLGSGAVISGLPGPWSPEARSAEAAWRDAAPDLERRLLDCESGRELVGRGLSEDVRYAARAGVSETVPVLVNGAFSTAR